MLFGCLALVMLVHGKTQPGVYHSLPLSLSLSLSLYIYIMHKVTLSLSICILCIRLQLGDISCVNG